MKKNAILTFDYELFLGKRTGTVLNSVIRPTRLILDTLQRENARAIFFVDATWLLFLQKNSIPDLRIISEQVRDIIRQGSSVELHLHPQWLRAQTTGDIISFNGPEYYKLQAFKQHEVTEIFKNSIELLESITLQRVRCYRAGGFCIEPFAHIKNAFEAHKIRYDFSSVPGVYLKSGHDYDFDFRSAPDLMYYPFRDNVTQPDRNGDYYEFPVSTYNNNPFYRIYNLGLLRLKKDKIFGDGEGIQQELSLISRLKSKKLGFSRTFLTLDQMDHNLFKFILKYHYGKKQLIVILSHPKTFSARSAAHMSYVTRNYITMNSDDLDRYLMED